PTPTSSATRSSRPRRTTCPPSASRWRSSGSCWRCATDDGPMELARRVPTRRHLGESASVSRRGLVAAELLERVVDELVVHEGVDAHQLPLQAKTEIPFLILGQALPEDVAIGVQPGKGDLVVDRRVGNPCRPAEDLDHGAL